MAFFTARMTGGSGDDETECEMSQPVTAFLTNQTVEVAVTDEVCVGLGQAPGTKFPLRALTESTGGNLYAEFDNGDGSIIRYLLPPGSVLFARQQITQPPAPQPPAAG